MKVSQTDLQAIAELQFSESLLPSLSAGNTSFMNLNPINFLK
jgi:hypothetical protein